jgi:hypothetical protein
VTTSAVTRIVADGTGDDREYEHEIVAVARRAALTHTMFTAMITRGGHTHQAKRYSRTHIWQLLMAAQVPIVVFFAFKWVPQSPRQAVPILALQVAAALVAMAPVFLLHW